MDSLQKYRAIKKLESESSKNYESESIGKPMSKKKDKSAENLSDMSEAEMNKVKTKSKPTGGY